MVEVGMTGLRYSGSCLLRRSRLDFRSGTRNEFRRRLVWPCGMWSKFQRPCFSCMVSGAVGCASRPTCRRSHRPAAAVFSTQPAGARAGAPGGGRAPRDHRRCRAMGEVGMTGPRYSGSCLLRRSRLDFRSGTRNEFRRRLAWPHGLWSKFQRPRFSCWVGLFNFPARQDVCRLWIFEGADAGRASRPASNGFRSRGGAYGSVRRPRDIPEVQKRSGFCITSPSRV
jgi:hypothetical protein